MNNNKNIFMGLHTFSPTVGYSTVPSKIDTSWQASEASETLLGVTNGNRIYVIYIYLYIVRATSLL